MFRGRETRQHITLALALAALALAGCIFSPSTKDKTKKIEPYPPIVDSKSLIENLRLAYQKRDYDKFATLFSNGTAGQPAYLFLLSEPTQTGETSWGYTEEMRIHRRMFQPERPLPGETPVPSNLWLRSVQISLTPQSDFIESLDLYRSPSNPDGIDPDRWVAREATYWTFVFFQLAGDTDYQVNGLASYVVIEDKTKTNADPGKWLLYRWEELAYGASQAPGLAGSDAAAPLGVQAKSWGGVKLLYK